MFARTPRLFLRPGWPEDAPALAAAIGHSSVARYLEQVPFPYDGGDAAEWLARPAVAGQVELLILSHDADRPAIVGGVALLPRGGALSLGYWLTPAAWGRGYATEAGRAAIGIARHAIGASRLTARHHVDNPRSANVLRKLGFRPTGAHETLFSRGRGCPVANVLVALDLRTDASGDDAQAALAA